MLVRVRKSSFLVAVFNHGSTHTVLEEKLGPVPGPSTGKNSGVPVVGQQGHRQKNGEVEQTSGCHPSSVEF